MTFEIRTASRDDAAAIARVHIESWRAGYDGLVPAEVLQADDFESSRIEMWSAWRFNPGQRVSVYVQRSDGGDDEEVVGFATYGPEQLTSGDVSGRGELYAIYFLREAWGSGAAATMIGHVEERLRAEGFASAVLWVLKNNPRARAFYERHGWSPTGRGADFEAHGIRLPEIQYAKDL